MPMGMGKHPQPMRPGNDVATGRGANPHVQIEMGGGNRRVSPMQTVRTYGPARKPSWAYGPTSLFNTAQLDYAHQYNQERGRLNSAGALTTTPAPMGRPLSPISSGRSSPYGLDTNRHGNRTPMADVDTAVWAQVPMVSPSASSPGNHTAAPVQDRADFPPFQTPLDKPVRKSKRNRSHGQYVHGERVMISADSMRLWSRPDEDRPTGPGCPEEGFADDVVRIARR